MESGEVERELEELETRIERLRALYEQYFMGIERLEPLIPRKDVERRIWVMRREQIRNTGLRFKFQMLIQRYNTFQQYWGRISREIENGTYRRDVIRAAKRVGAKEALTIVGRKRAERYAELAEQQETAREPVHRADGSGDHEEIDVDDEAVTLAPPPLPAASLLGKRSLAALAAEEAAPRAAVAPLTAPEASSAAPASAPVRPALAPLTAPEASSAAPASAPVRPALAPPAMPQAAVAVKPAPLGGLPRGLGLTRPQQKPAESKAAEAKPAEASPAGAKSPARPAVDKAQPAAGANSRQRLAELAAEMRAQRTKTGDAAKAGPPEALTDVASEPPPAPKRPPPPSPAKPSPGAPAEAPAVAAAAAAGDAKGTGARRQERVHSERPPSARRRRSTAPPAAETGAASGARQTAPRTPSRPPEAARAGLDAAVRARPAPPQRSAARDDELPEQRLRQIYAKYVETKRAARESTAGVTYERLAESLRAQAAKLRATNPAKSVDYDVVVKDGKTLLKPILK
ncbi:MULTISPECIES: MXAN_5187 C-terminal domain-containing protein [Sorangium]|uniref:Alanine/proline-rich protein n=1 Tax=Sorangium cellulosum (strain So ce56) TaxID=448385 RepID=A9GR86_SORC5|nr:MXAN_5187 C-terminal domain-containing protein [Sorangium cellulosum]CAN90557.1 Alanine/proline-rich protein [Sorangium cellulosum So ce56]